MVMPILQKPSVERYMYIVAIVEIMASYSHGQARSAHPEQLVWNHRVSLIELSLIISNLT